MIDSFTFMSDSVQLPEFEVALELSKKAEDTLKARKESVVVQAFFMGVPMDTLQQEYLEMGEMFIGKQHVELWNERVARFAGIKLPRHSLDSLKERNFRVLVNVTSGRRTHVNNLLSVDILQDGIDSVRGRRHLLKGKLIGER